MAKHLRVDEQIIALDAHHLVEVRIFKPLAYRGHSMLLRALEFLFDASRLDYRMHNKLLVVDNEIALIGGRNIGDQFFQVNPESQVADEDVFAAGPIVQQLSATFDEFWNNMLSIPAQALLSENTSYAALKGLREELKLRKQVLITDGVDYVKRIVFGEPFNRIISGSLPLTWAHAKLFHDSPNKKEVENGVIVGRLMQGEVTHVAAATHAELLMVTPYLIPGEEGMRLFKDLHQRNVRVRLLTNSLESSTSLPAQSGYMRYRVPLLTDGVELYEIRAQLGNNKGSGQTSVWKLFPAREAVCIRSPAAVHRLDEL